MRLYIVPGVGVALDTAFNNNKTVTKLTKTISIPSNQSIVDAVQRSKKPTNLKSPLNQELVLVLEDTINAEIKPINIETDVYTVSFIRMPESINSTSVYQPIANGVDTRVEERGSASLSLVHNPFRIPNFTMYRTDALTHSTLRCQDAERNYVRNRGDNTTEEYIAIAKGRDYWVEGEFLVNSHSLLPGPITPDIIEDAEVSCEVYLFGTPLPTISIDFKTTTTRFLEDSTDSSSYMTRIAFSGVMPAVGRDAKIVIYISSYTTSSSPSSGALGTILEKDTYALIQDMNNRITSKLFGPFYFYRPRPDASVIPYFLRLDPKL